MKQKAALLLAIQDHQWTSIQSMIEKIRGRKEFASWSEQETVFLAYLLHNIYSAFEELFKQIAKTFENQLDDSGRYHAELLRRMALEIHKIRPAFLSFPSLEVLEELRRFRHLFRHAYDFDLMPERIDGLAERVEGARSNWEEDAARFRRFLMQLIEE